MELTSLCLKNQIGESLHLLQTFIIVKKFIALSYMGYVIVINVFGMFLHHNLEELLMVDHSN